VIIWGYLAGFILKNCGVGYVFSNLFYYLSLHFLVKKMIAFCHKKKNPDRCQDM
jgi:hypothetical protein